MHERVAITVPVKSSWRSQAPTIYPHNPPVVVTTNYPEATTQPNRSIAMVFYDKGIVDSVRMLESKIDAINTWIDEFEDKLDVIHLEMARIFEESASLDGADETYHRMSNEDLSDVIAAFFASDPEREIYPSDVARRYGIDYDRAANIIERLIADGKVRES